MSHFFWESFSKQNWMNVPTPWKPSFGDLFIFFLYIIKSQWGKDVALLLIGATKELRWLLKVLKINYDMIDYSENMKKVTEQRNDTLAIFYKQDWLKNTIDKKYDFIFGDLVLNLLSEKEALIFIDNYKKKLKKNGSILLRTRVHTQESDFKKISNLLHAQLTNINKVPMYTIFANVQSLSKKNEEVAQNSFDNALSESDHNTKDKLLFFKKIFLLSELKYYIHDERFYKKLNATIFNRKKYRNYFDTFCFLLIKNS